MRNLVVLTAIFDGYDTLLPRDEEAKVDYYCITDGSIGEVEGWNVLVKDIGLSPIMANRYVKMFPWRFLPPDVGDTVIYVDGSVDLFEGAALRISRLLDDQWIAQFVHPFRDCIFDEAVELELLGRRGAWADIAKYRPNHPDHWGLWSAGVIAWRHTPQREQFAKDWFRAVFDSTVHRDQLHQAPLFRRNEMRPVQIPGNLHEENDFLSLHPHKERVEE